MKKSDIAKELRVDDLTADRVFKCIRSYDYATKTEGGEARIAECFNPPDEVDVQLHAINQLLGGFGIEYIADTTDTYTEMYGIDYVNMGDTYTCTVCYDHQSDQWLLSDWGTLLEENPDRFE